MNNVGSKTLFNPVELQAPIFFCCVAKFVGIVLTLDCVTSRRSPEHKPVFGNIQLGISEASPTIWSCFANLRSLFFSLQVFFWSYVNTEIFASGL
jgi:hypothetical protein